MYYTKDNMSTKLDILYQVLLKAPNRIFIQMHNVPDPDAIASAMGLHFLLSLRGIQAGILYDSTIEKSNALKMLDIFAIRVAGPEDVPDLSEKDWTVLVDGQKGNSNLTDLSCNEVAVIDHHEKGLSNEYLFSDIRPEIGSCSAIIAEYFFENSILPNTQIASALLYGILNDTDGLSRGTSLLDIEMHYKLFPLVNTNHIQQLRGAEISRIDLERYAKAFQSVEYYGELAIIEIENVNDSLLGAASDIILSVTGTQVVVAFSIREQGIKISIRSIDPFIFANDLVRKLCIAHGVGGGHAHMAGGFIQSVDPLDVKLRLTQELKYLARDLVSR
jgi:nanoRNase/pAp phosphatase (c-di-AMP/oligoRNAs hydrolase)